jgi:WD40 repeat protein
MSTSLHWLESIEYAALAAAVAGTIYAVSSSTWLYAIVPLLVSSVLNIINRIRQAKGMEMRNRELAQRVNRDFQQQVESLQQEINQARSFSTALVKQTLATQKAELALAPAIPEEFQALEQKYDLQQQLMQTMQAHVAGVESSLKEVVELLETNAIPDRVDRIEQSYTSIAQQLGISGNDTATEIPPDSVDIAPLLDMISEDLISGDLISGDLISGDLISGDLSGDLWDRPTWKLAKTLNAHTDWVRCLSFTPSGEELVSGSFDKTISLWKIATGEKQYTLTEHAKGVFALAVSPDGRFLASGSWDESIKLWDLPQGQLLSNLNHHQASVRSLAISPDSKILYSGSFDRSIGVCTLPEGELIKKIQDQEPISAIAIDTDGKILASTGDDGTIHLWQPETGAAIASLTGNNHCICSMTFAPDAKSIAAGTVNGYTIIWDLHDLSTQKLLSPLQSIKAHSGQINSCIFSPDGKYLITGSVDGKAKVWYKGEGISFRDRSRSVLKGDPGRSVMSIAIAPDSQQVAVGGADGTIQIWRVE